MKKEIPIWFMRQAGRYLPEYRKVRRNKPNFFDLCFDPLIASEISLQPIKRFDFDFIILFSDILTIPYALNQQVSFEENHGPRLKTINGREDLDYKNIDKCLSRLDPVFETIDALNTQKGRHQLIGFCGGPFTVLNYMIEGGTSKKHEKIKDFVKNKKVKALDLIDILTEISIEYLKRQIRKGADRVQIFDSWAGIMKGKDYEDFIIKPNKKINQEVKKFSPNTQITHFPRSSKNRLIDFLTEVNCDVISLDQDCPDEVIKFTKDKGITVQGNLSPLTLVKGGKKLETEIKECLEKFKHHKHIFNLSHGILKNTPLDNVYKTIEIVRNYEFTKVSS